MTYEGLAWGGSFAHSKAKEYAATCCKATRASCVKVLAQTRQRDRYPQREWIQFRLAESPPRATAWEVHFGRNDEMARIRPGTWEWLGSAMRLVVSAVALCSSLRHRDSVAHDDPFSKVTPARTTPIDYTLSPAIP